VIQTVTRFLVALLLEMTSLYFGALNKRADNGLQRIFGLLNASERVRISTHQRLRLVQNR
jgi:hypothetical protein